MRSLFPILLSLTGCISPSVSVVTTNDSGSQDDVTDTNDTEVEALETSSSLQYGRELLRGWHVLLDGQHGLMREFPANLTEEFTNILSWEETWGFSVSLGAPNAQVHDYFVSGAELPLFQTEGRLLTMKFSTQSAPVENCASEKAVKPVLLWYHVDGTELCEEIKVDFISNAKSFCKDLTDEEWSTLGDDNHPHSDYLESGFIVTVIKIGNEMKLWINQHEVATSGEVYLDANSECDASFPNDSRELYFGKGMILPDGREIGNLVSRVDNIVLLTPYVDPADLPGVFNVWERSGESHELFSNVDLVSNNIVNFEDGFGWWTFENPVHSPHDTDASSPVEAQFVLDFSPVRGGMEMNGPNNLMRLINLDNDDEIVDVGNLYVNQDNQYMDETNWE